MDITIIIIIINSLLDILLLFSFLHEMIIYHLS